MTQQDLDELKIAYRIIKKIMKDEHMAQDTSFVRVKNFISNKICDELTN